MIGNLESLTLDLQNFCDQNEIVCFPGSIDYDKGFISCEYGKRNSGQDFNDFLSIIKQLKIKIVIIEKDINEIKEFIDDENILEKIGSDLLYIINEKNNQIASLKISFIYKGVCYFFKSRSEWYSDYRYVFLRIEEYEEEKDAIDFGLSNSDSIDKIEYYARQIVNKDDFIKSKNNLIRREIVLKYLEELIDINQLKNILSDIIRRCYQIYNDEIKPKVDKEMLLNVLELKAKGLKKVEIQGRLGISEKILNNFYYKDKTV